MKTRTIQFLMVLIVAGVVAGCDSGGNGQASSSSGQGGTGAQVTIGDSTQQTSMMVDVGGAVLMGMSGTPLAGVMVDIPPGAIEGLVEITLGYNSGTVEPVVGEAGGVLIELGSSTQRPFRLPVEITFPFDSLRGGTEITAIPIPYYIDDNGAMQIVTLVDIDPIAGTATLSTDHASFFTWLVCAANLDNTPSSVFTGFIPGTHDFKVRNVGTDINRTGECLGMTTFSLWYYLNHSPPTFHTRFGTVFGTRIIKGSTVPIVGQNVIATRAFNSINQMWSRIPAQLADLILSDETNACIIKSNLANTLSPTIILLSDNGFLGHSVLAYGYREIVEAGTFVTRILIADPNWPGDTNRFLEYDHSTKRFRPYGLNGKYNEFVYLGFGSLDLLEPYSNILSDAEQDFQSSIDATIQITSHMNGDVVNTRTIQLSGTIESGEALVTNLVVSVNSTFVETAIGLDGGFSVALPMSVGENHIQFTTTSDLDAINPTLTVNNNFNTQDFVLHAFLDGTAILTTLTWSEDDTDVDLYVIDPTGDFSSYYHKLTADGGELDIDIIFGFGPEHWTLERSDMVRYGEPYTVRIHYYSDHGNGPTNYSVSILLNEGTDFATFRTFSGNLSVSNPSNDGPLDVGADWRDIATVVPTLSSSSGPVLMFFDSLELSASEITVQVPSIEERAILK